MRKEDKYLSEIKKRGIGLRWFANKVGIPYGRFYRKITGLSQAPFFPIEQKAIEQQLWGEVEKQPD